MGAYSLNLVDSVNFTPKSWLNRSKGGRGAGGMGQIFSIFTVFQSLFKFELVSSQVKSVPSFQVFFFLLPTSETIIHFDPTYFYNSSCDYLFSFPEGGLKVPKFGVRSDFGSRLTAKLQMPQTKLAHIIFHFKKIYLVLSS